jgi:hypothetical protein
VTAGAPRDPGVAALVLSIGGGWAVGDAGAVHATATPATGAGAGASRPG